MVGWICDKANIAKSSLWTLDGEYMDIHCTILSTFCSLKMIIIKFGGVEILLLIQCTFLLCVKHALSFSVLFSCCYSGS